MFFQDEPRFYLMSINVPVKLSVYTLLTALTFVLRKFSEKSP